MAEVDRGQRQPLTLDVLPDVQLRPVGDREDAHVLAAMHAGIEQAPQFGALSLGIPLAEFVPERKNAFLGARLFLVAPRAPDAGIETELLDSLQQRHGLGGVARIGFTAQHHAAPRDRVLDAAHDQGFAQLGRARVAEGDHFVEVVPGIDVHQREREAAWPEGLLGQAQQHHGILAAREQQDGLFAFRGDLAQDEYRFRFQPIQVAALDDGRHDYSTKTDFEFMGGVIRRAPRRG
ncbi:hypothetical protein FQZ97_645210 [compost metagenome]